MWPIWACDFSACRGRGKGDSPGLGSGLGTQATLTLTLTQATLPLTLPQATLTLALTLTQTSAGEVDVAMRVCVWGAGEGGIVSTQAGSTQGGGRGQRQSQVHLQAKGAQNHTPRARVA